MYVVRDDKDNNNDDFVDTTIKKGSKIKLDFKCKEAGCALKWVVLFAGILSNAMCRCIFYSLFIGTFYSVRSICNFFFFFWWCCSSLFVILSFPFRLLFFFSYFSFRSWLRKTYVLGAHTHIDMNEWHFQWTNEQTHICTNNINRTLRWEFRTFDHDIRFGIKRINEKTGEENVEVDMKRVASHQLDEEGFITCQPDWTCEYKKRTFDTFLFGPVLFYFWIFILFYFRWYRVK